MSIHVPPRARRLAAVAALLLLAACPGPSAKPPPPPPSQLTQRDCATTFHFDDGSVHTSVVVSGPFDGWSETADRMTRGAGTTWSLKLDLAAGEHPYKLVVDGTWIRDPADPFTIWSGGQEDSKLTVPDCSQPGLRLDHFAAHPDGTVAVHATYLDDTAKAGPDPKSATATLDGATLAKIGFQAANGTFDLSLDGVPAGKHTLVISVSDAAGQPAPPLYLPFWIEARPFSFDGGLLYFAFTDRFKDGDPTNDDPVAQVATQANYQGGDFAGITQEIDAGYFDKLGVTALWISPVQANPGAAFPGDDGRDYTGYHGYWPSAPRTTQARFGSLEDLKALTAAAHAHGIRVLADVVFNHVHVDDPYYQQHQHDGWFNGDGSCICGAPDCDWNTFRLTCWFAPYLADLNWRNPDVDDTMIGDTLWWLKQADLDGFRVDAVKHFDKVAVRNLRGELLRIEHRTGVHYHLVGETFTGDGDADRKLIAQYLGPGMLDGQFDFPLYWNVVRAFARGEETFKDLDAAVQAGQAAWPAGSVMSLMLGNQDVPRIYSHAAGDIADVWGNGAKQQAWDAPPAAHDDDVAYGKLRLAFAFLLTQPGLPLIYYGDEYGMPGAGDPDNRRPMRFGADLLPREASLLTVVRQLGRLRRDVPALQKGGEHTLSVDDDLYVYDRDAGADQIAIVALNRGATDRTVTVTLPGVLGQAPRVSFDERLGGGTQASADGKLTITVPAGSAQVWTPTP